MAILHQKLQEVCLISETAYRELVKTQLARLIDIECGFDFDQIYQSDSSVHSGFCFELNFRFFKLFSIFL